MFYRYELYVDGEPQNIGFIQGLDDTGLSENEKEELAGLFDEMAIPSYVFEQYRTQSWFSDYGMEFFADKINRIIQAYEEDGLFEVVCLENDDLSDFNILYEDEYQTIIEFRS